MAFVHLHVHSEYSLLDGACRVRDLASKAAAMGQTSIAVTDHGVMYGAVAFYKEAIKAGVKPIIGCEVYIAPRTRFGKDPALDSERYHLILLCKNDTGYKNLCHIVSAAFTEGFYTKPRADIDLIRRHHDGLIALSACIYGEIPRLILKNDYKGAKAKALEMQEIFGSGNFYLELQSHGFADQPAANDGIIKLHRETGIPLVVTNDVHYITRADAAAQDILMCIQTGKKYDDTDRMRFESEELYLKSEDEMRTLFPGDEYLQAFDNTVAIADMCNFAFDFTSHHLPEFKLPDGENNSDEYLRKLCRKGLSELYKEEEIADPNGRLNERLDFELSMISKMGFTDYFLIMNDCIAYCRSQDIPVGPGRGSAAGSLVSYCLGLTKVDPIKYRLYFERFLNPERVTMPDIDIDFCERRRGEAIDYVKEKYGADRVAQIVTFGTLKPKVAVRSVAKAVGLTFAEENMLAREVPGRMPDGSPVTVEKALNLSTKLKTLYNEDPRVKRVIDMAKALEDMPKDSSTHASGIVITKNPVRDYLPLTLSKKDNTIATQYTMIPLEELGLLKMDFLGLRNLTVIDDAVKEIRKTNPAFDINKIPDDDEDTYAMLSRGDTSGVFQIESQGMTGVCTGLRPKSIEDITAIIALYRPGPMDSIPRFLQWSREPSLIKYKHPALEPILSVTYGCILYQEQVIEIFRKLGGFSVGQADMIRRAMSKKKIAEIDREKKSFIDGDEKRNICGAVKNGIPRDTAASIYEEIEAFANYAFNKSHAVAYAIISYQTAYLKCHYGHIYMAALLSSMLNNADKIAVYTAACKKNGINLLPPDINHSGAGFTVSGNNLRYGLAAVKNIGTGVIDKLAAERESGGLFTGFQDFCIRMYGGELNQRAVESLIKCGCFDGLGANRRQLMMIYRSVIDSITQAKKRNIDGQMDLFGLSGPGAVNDETPSLQLELPDLPEFSKGELTRMEKEVTGLYLSGHPLDDYQNVIKNSNTVYIGDILADSAQDDEDEDINAADRIGLSKFTDNQKVTLAGIIEKVETRPTRTNSLMAYINLDDGSGMIELIAFQRIIDEAGHLMQAGELILVHGKISERDEKNPQIIIDKLYSLDELRDTGITPQPPPASKTAGSAGRTLYIRISSETADDYTYLKELRAMYPGNDKMVVVFADTNKKAGAACSIKDAFITKLKEKFGDANVVLK